MDSFYGIKMQVFLLILEVCILVCASIIHGSAGNDVAWSPANFPSGPPDKGRTPSFVYHQRPSLPPLQDEYDIARSPANSPASPENKRAPGFAYHEEAPRVSNPSPPSPVDGPTVHSSMSSAPASESSDGPVQSIPSIPRTALPPRNLATPPKTLQRLSPHIPSRTYSRAPDIYPVTMPLHPEPAVIPISAPPPSTTKDQRRRSVATPPKETSNHLVPMNRSQSIGASSPLVSPATKRATKSGHFATPPSKSFPKPLPGKWFHRPASSPSISFNEHNYSRAIATSPVPAPPLLHPATPFQQDTAKPPAPSQSSTLVPRKNWQRHHNPPQMKQGPSVSPSSPFPPSRIPVSPVASPSLPVPSGRTRRVLPPTISPIGSYAKKPVTPLPSQVLALPPPPPNRDCTSIVCVEPLTNTPPGSPCSCVQPMQVGLQLNVAIYTFFPLVSELAFEIASGIFMKQSQVRIIGANAVSQQLDKTIVLIDLVPLGTKFDAATALLTFERFWHKKVIIKSSFFGEYDVLYVHYPGLPPSPPSTPLSVSAIDGGPHFGQDNSARTIHPLGVDVRKKQKDGLGRSMIAVIVLSSSIAMGIVIGAAWLLIPKGADRSANHNSCLPKPTTQTSIPSSAKPTAFESGPSSAGLSFGSSIAAYTGSAKTFTLGEMERATDNFDASKLLGEGGFGRVYRGVLDDGTTVAIKVLKRDDQQGGREFMAEVEMLSRLHHRNLVKLIGICIEGNARCLVYELVPNGSVESHLHGVDKESGPLDWGARMKIALGAARGLAYLHEDSSPRVIHRDFKASNILLEDDYTPKVSDFGLARTALDEESKHISTRVMGTFGYVAPEYAMTGHLLVKSDVYSYGVVLLELLTGRKPVDMSQPLGQENLVAWARPLLTSKEGLEIIIDPSLGSNFPLDCIAKVAAIASMCVQPEVSHRPFMGEVVQALKLVCEESDETRELGSESCCSRDDASNTDKDAKVATPMFDYSTLRGVLSASDRFDTSTRFGRQVSGSFRRHSSSGPLRSWRSRRIWDRVRGVSRGSVSEHGFTFKFWGRSH